MKIRNRLNFIAIQFNLNKSDEKFDQLIFSQFFLWCESKLRFSQISSSLLDNQRYLICPTKITVSQCIRNEHSYISVAVAFIKSNQSRTKTTSPIKYLLNAFRKRNPTPWFLLDPAICASNVQCAETDIIIDWKLLQCREKKNHPVYLKTINNFVAKRMELKRKQRANLSHFL